MWLWGGLALFSALTMYDMQVCLNKCKKEENYDPISTTLELYMDALGSFIGFLTVMMKEE